MKHGSLCSGYDGIGLALAAVLDAELAWVCDYDDGPSLVLAHRYPHLTNHRDLTALTWAQEPVDIVSAGYPCQPFSGAGKRLGTDDPRHLFPWIAKGIGIMRPPLVLLENVRGHLTLGWDVVLLELHRLGYDVRWTLLRAADVGAPHGRARLFALAADRDVHRWGHPTTYPVRTVGVGGQWVEHDHSLFGEVACDTAPPSAGVMVNGVVWEEPALLGGQHYSLLPTPAVNDMGKAYTPEQWDAWCAKQQAAHGNGNGHGPSLEVEAARMGEALLPTPRTTDSNGAGVHGTGGLDLRTAVDLLPTPTARDKKGHNQRRDNTCLTGVLLPTPAATDANGARNSTAGRKPDSQHHSGDTLGDLIFRGDLLPTPTTEPETGNGHARYLGKEATLLPTPRATDGTKGGPNQAGSSGDLMLPSAVMPSRWGRYAAAVARCEALTRPAPDPTAPTGKKGAQRLSPAFVEWLMMLPDGWVTDPAIGLKRDQQLKLLGNGVVPPQAAAAVRHLRQGLGARKAVAA